MRRSFLLLVFLLSPLLTACPGHSGTLMNDIADNADFVSEPMTIFYSTNLGYHQVDLDGTNRATILVWNRVGVEHSFTLKEVSSDRSLWVYNDSDTNLFFQYGPGTELHRIPELDRRLSSVAIHPDGSRVVASRHADFSQPMAAWVDDDRLYVIDVASREVAVLAEESDQRISQMFWDEAGEHLYLEYFQPRRTIRVNTDTGARTEVSETPALRRWRRSQTECPTTKERLESDDEGIYIVTAGGSRQQIIFIQDRKRGFHDYQRTIEEMHFSDTCAHVFFVFRNGLYVVNVETQLVAVLVDEGIRSIFLLPE